MTTTNIYVISGKGKYYVGKANNLSTRFAQHKAKAKKGDGNPRKTDWILKNERHLRLKRLETVDARKWREREQHWISHYRRKYGDHAIMNSSSGGEGPIMIGENAPTIGTPIGNQAWGLTLMVIGICLSLTGYGALVGIPLVLIGLKLHG